MGNKSMMTDFLLMGFSDDHDMQLFYYLMFLFVYLTAVVGNFLIISAVALNQHLHTPMYFFLVNLSFVDICYISTTVPKTIAVTLTNNKMIPYAGCVAQVFLIITFVGAEIFLLTIMAYDRYVAICHPLQYRLIMNWNACIEMAAVAWMSTLIHAVLETSLTFRVNFCGFNRIGQFFCNMPQLQKIACTDSKVHQILIFLIGLSVNSFCFAFILISYCSIFSAVLKIPSVQGRYKAFSTCIPHLAVFALFIITAVFSFLKPKSLSSPTVDLISGFMYTVLPPVLNPIIYSLRNKDIQGAVQKIPHKLKDFMG
ncbi:olfactory receptor 14A16-like [Python bivittatus]|uniref:Olfactory receptor n=1 Tax=Python bivittatus TaxID=176946 RepID=A0A9F5IQ75_PYTBI|nr:olfactory receptor 14A16-like [Python bivittatus]